MARGGVEVGVRISLRGLSVAIRKCWGGRCVGLPRSNEVEWCEKQSGDAG